MSEYRAPVKDMGFVINELAGLEQIAALPGYEEATPDLVEAVLEEAGTLAAEVIAPTNMIGDAKGTHVEDGQVIVPPEFHSIYKQYVEGGWAGIGFAAGLTGDTDGLGAVGAYKSLSSYTSLGGTLTVFAL